MGRLGMLYFLNALQAKDGFLKKIFRVSGRSLQTSRLFIGLGLFPFTDKVNTRVPSLLFHAELSHSQKPF